jgi:hypothetical protein
LRVTGWTEDKVATAYAAIDPRCEVTIVWTPPPETRTETPLDAARRTALVAQKLKA